MTLPNAVTALITARRLEQVPADLGSVRARLSRAEDKLATARTIATIGIEIAYGTAYDATRIAVSARMLSIGYRVRAVAGAHAAAGSSRLRDPQRMRRRRNNAEYDDVATRRCTTTS